jgi:predicted GTPase
MGSSGAGKSSTINNLLENMNNEAAVGKKGNSETKTVTCFTGFIQGRAINLFDTPGFKDSHGLSDEYIMGLILQKICSETKTKTIDCFLIAESLVADRIYSSLYTQ